MAHAALELSERELDAYELELEREALRMDSEASLAVFMQEAWPLLEPGRQFAMNWHIDVICEHLEAVKNGEIRNLIINIPPRHTKSMLVSVMFPAWVWATEPHKCFLYGSYSPKLASRDSNKCRRLIKSPWYQHQWGTKDGNPWVQIKHDQDEKMRYENAQAGTRIATTPGGTGTGDGGDIIVVDDPHKVKGIESEVQRNSVIEWWDEEMSTRGNDSTTVAKVIIMQRVHHRDLSGHCLAKGNYEHLVIPQE